MNLSPTKLNVYGSCPRQFQYRYVNHYRSQKNSANLEFGKAVHKALEDLFNDGADPIQTFEGIWEQFEDEDLDYSRYDDWEKLMNVGAELLDIFIKDWLHKFVDTYTVEDWLKFKIDEVTNFWGRGDWIGKVKLDSGELVNAIVDFKTSSRKYDKDKIQFNDQLTSYYHAGKKYPFRIDKVIYLVLVKTKKPYIQLIEGDRTEDDVRDFLKKANYYNEQINEGKFHKNYGMHCKWCDYQALCLQDEERIKDELMVEIGEIKLLPGVVNDLGKCPDFIEPMDYVEQLVKDNDIYGNFKFKVTKLYSDPSYTWEGSRKYIYQLKGTELERIYKNTESEVA